MLELDFFLDARLSLEGVERARTGLAIILPVIRSRPNQLQQSLFVFAASVNFDRNYAPGKQRTIRTLDANEVSTGLFVPAIGRTMLPLDVNGGGEHEETLLKLIWSG